MALVRARAVAARDEEVLVLVGPEGGLEVGVWDVGRGGGCGECERYWWGCVLLPS